MTPAERKREKEKKTVSEMIRIYCRGRHGGKALCPACEALEQYALRQTDHCPFMEKKTFCSCCKVHCYQPEMRERIREVMRYSGPRMLFVHPFMALSHLYETVKQKILSGRDKSHRD